MRQQEQRDELRQLKKDINKELKLLDKQIKKKVVATVEDVPNSYSSTLILGNDTPDRNIQAKLNLLKRVVNHLQGGNKDV